jgi:micrococcal nuclease
MTSILRKTFLFALFLVLVTISVAGAGTLGKTLPAQVVSITDGDTIVVDLQGHKERVRLIGIDAPECRPNPKAQKDSIRTGDDIRTITEMGKRATRYVKTVIRPGDQVSIELDVQDRDRYGRLLGYIWLQDGRMLNEEIARAGYAGLMTIPPNVRYHQRLQEAFRDSQESRRGLGKIKEP